MVTKNYNVTLDDKVVNEALEISKPYGGKLSPVLNQLLEKWVKEKKSKSSKSKVIPKKETKELDIEKETELDIETDAGDFQ